MSSFEKLWYQSNENQKIPPDIAKRWLNLIQTKYNTEPHRIYHNLNVLNKNERNCTAFREFITEAAIDNATVSDSVCHLLGDASKNFSGNFEDVELFQDLDLIVLGSPPNEYKEYQQATQKEYSHLDENTYKKTRLRILETFLQIPQIYSVSCIRERLEEAARANIKLEITELKV